MNKIDTKLTDGNLTLNKINNMKRDIEINRNNLGNNFGQPINQFNVGKNVQKSDFEKRRNNQINSQRSTKNAMRPSRGKEIAEVMLRRVADENGYYNNKKHTFMSGAQSKGPYQNTTPDYFRILEKPNNKADP